jgi:Flp pilus assembly protein TadB
VNRGLRRTPLASRLRPHVAGEFNAVEHGWWAPPSAARPLPEVTGWRLAWWRVTARRRRVEHLGQVVEQLAVFVSNGSGLADAIARVADRGHGVVIDDLAAVAALLRQGQPVDHALRRWAAVAACDGIGRLAAAVTAAAPAGDLAERLWTLADVLCEQAHDEELARVQRVARLVQTITAAALVTALVTMRP